MKTLKELKPTGNKVEYYDRFTGIYTAHTATKADCIELIQCVDITLIGLRINHYDYTAYAI